VDDPTLKRLPERHHRGLVHVARLAVNLRVTSGVSSARHSCEDGTSAEGAHLELGHVPVGSLGIRLIGSPLDMDALDCERRVAREKRESANRSTTPTLPDCSKSKGCLPCWNSCLGSDHLYGLNCHSWPVVITHTTRSLRCHMMDQSATTTERVGPLDQRAYQASSTPPNFAKASTLSTTKYLAFLASGPCALVLAWYTCSTSSVRPVDEPLI
jgi:hypothetical protein